MSEFYDKVKKLHDKATKENKQKYFDKAYAKIEETLGSGADKCLIRYYDSDDDVVEKELIAMLENDCFHCEFDDKEQAVVVTL